MKRTSKLVLYHLVPSVTAGKFTLDPYDPRSNGARLGVWRTYAAMANGKECKR
jgi:hypothetical protein